jgi:hypothetical protein
MNDLNTIAIKNLEASVREGRQLVEEVANLEAQLDVPTSYPERMSIASLRRRLDNLHNLAASRIDPNEEWTQKTPIILGNYRQERASSRR